MRKLFTFGVSLLLFTVAVQKDWLRINWFRIQDDLGINKLIDPETNRIRPLK